LRLLSGSGNILGYLVLILPLAVAAWGQESVLAPAMVSYDQSPAQRLSPVATPEAPASASNSIVAPSLQYQRVGWKIDRPNIAAGSFDASLKKQDEGYRRDGLQLLQKKSGGDRWADFWRHLEAGYGQFCRLESGFERRSMETEPLRCAYLRAQFSF
jgi:hypothetical protein